MLGLNGTFDTGLRTMVRGFSRWGTLCGVLAMLVFVTGCPTPGARCTEDAECDDGAFCNGAETCGANGRCAAGTAPCDADAGETCNEDTDSCDVCAEDADCDDGDLCTDDACVDGQCENTAADCDDGLDCTDDSCDADTGECGNESNCAEGEVCNETTGACDTVCTTDDDCAACEECTDGACTAVVCEDDGDLCTSEACNADTGACESTPIECEAGEVCVDGVCTVTPCTEDADCEDDGLFCNGTESCDLDASACVSSGDPCTEDQTCNETTDECDDPTGMSFTLSASGTDFDSIVGTSGNDTAIAGPNALQTGDVVDLAGGSGDRLTATLAGTAATPVIANTEIIEFSLLASTNITASGISASSDGTSLKSTANSGITLTLTSFNEAINLEMSGAGNLAIASLASDDTLDVVNLAISGTVGTFTDTSSHINQLNISATGSKVTVGAGTIDSSATTEEAQWTADADLTVEDTQVDNQFTAKFIDCTGVTGMCILELDADTTAAGAETLDLTNVLGVDKVLFSQDQSTNGFTFTAPPSTFEIEVVDDNANAHFAGALAVANNSLTGSTDTLTLKLGGDGDATGIAGAVTANGYEIVNVEVSSTGTTTGTYTFGSTFALDTGTVDRIETINVSGDQNVTFTGALTVDVLDASNLTKVLVVTAGAANAGTIMRGGSAADTLDQTANVATILQGNAGGDTIDCDNGTARQEIRYAEATDGAAAGASSGFDAVTQFDTAAGDTTDDIVAITGNLRTALDDGTGGGAGNGTLTFQSSTGAAANDAVATTVEGLFVREAESIANFTTPADIATGLNARFDLSNFATAGDDLFFVINTAGGTETFSWGVYTESGTGSEAQASEITILGQGTELLDATTVATGDFIFK